jgi:hypothetical protein
MKKASKKHLVIKRNTLKVLTELPSTAYRHVVGGNGWKNSTVCSGTGTHGDDRGPHYP